MPETAVRVSGDAAEVARAEAQAVLAMVQDEGRRARLADIVAAVDEGQVGEADADALAEWTEDEVWDYVREREVPYHPLYDRGHRSIGCAPCTRAIGPGASRPAPSRARPEPRRG